MFTYYSAKVGDSQSICTSVDPLYRQAVYSRKEDVKERLAITRKRRSGRSRRQCVESVHLQMRRDGENKTKSSQGFVEWKCCQKKQLIRCIFTFISIAIVAERIACFNDSSLRGRPTPNYFVRSFDLRVERANK